jgi:predicted transcriptional regulator
MQQTFDFSAKTQNFIRQIETGKISDNAKKILVFIYDNPGTTIFTMRNRMNMVHQSLTASISQIMDDGRIYINGIQEHDGNKYSKLFVETDERQIAKNQNARRMERFQKWLNQMDEFSDLTEYIKMKLAELHV